MTIRKFIKKLFVTIIMIGIVLAAVLKVGYILICKVIVMIIFAVLAIRYWVGEDIRKAEEEKRGTWLFTLGFIGLTVLTCLRPISRDRCSGISTCTLRKSIRNSWRRCF